MENQKIILSEFILLLSVAAIFIVIFIVIHRVLKKTSFFKGFTSVVVSICVSLLSLAGLSRLFVISDVVSETSVNRRDITFELILLPYSALVIAIILVVLLLSISNISKREQEKKPFKDHSKMTRR